MPTTEDKKPKKVDGAKAATPEALQKMINDRWPGAMKMADDPTFVIERIPTGLLALDTQLKGGLARGRHIELYGTSNVGKTAITFNTIATSQEAGLRCSFIDVEGTFDPEFAETQGVDLQQLALTDQNVLEQGHAVIDYMEAQLRSQLYDVIVLDSIATLLPKSEKESSIEDASMGTEQARLMSKALRKLTAANKRTVIIYINQTRQKVGAQAFAKQTITSGGLAMGFYAGTRLEIVRSENITRKGKRINISTGEEADANQVKGHRLLLRVEKDKTGSSHQAAETTLVYDYELGGFDYYEDLIYLGRKYKLIKKKSAQWSLVAYPDESYNGRPAIKKALMADDAVADELHEAIEQAAYYSEDEIEDDNAE